MTTATFQNGDMIVPDLLKIPTWQDKGVFHVVVEAPAGSALKFKYEPMFGGFTVSRPLSVGIIYPYDWGFVPGTKAEDGDPLDAMVLSTVPSYPGVIHSCQAVGVVRLTQKSAKGRVENDRVIAVPNYTCELSDSSVETELTKQRRKSLEQFFVSAAVMECKSIRIEGWDGPKAALKLITKSMLKTP